MTERKKTGETLRWDMKRSRGKIKRVRKRAVDRVWPKEWEYRRCWKGDKGRREGGGGRNNETIFSGTRKLA